MLLCACVPGGACGTVQGRGGGGNALDNIGASGGMRAAGGGSSLDDQLAGGSGRRMQFTSGRN